MGVEKILHRRFDKKEPEWDFMKFYKIVKYWAKMKYGLSTADLELLFFLYSEMPFSKADFKTFTQVFPFDVSRFERLLRDKWIVKWRNRTATEGALYVLAYKGNQAVTTIYKKLTGDLISEDRRENKLFKKTGLTYSNKTHRNALIEMNKEYRKRNSKMVNGRPKNIPYHD